MIDIYTIGAHLRTRPDDSGLALGVGRRAFVFDASRAGEIAPGWHLFRAPLPRQIAVTTYHSQLGLDIYREPDRVGITLGLRSGAAIARIQAEQTAVVELNYEPAAPERTRVRSCFGESECANYFLRP